MKIMLKQSKMTTKEAFDEWFYQIEDFSLKSERFFNECDNYFNNDDEYQKQEGEKIFVSWLRAAFEAGRTSNN